jgi:hypothetical protein
MNTIRWLLFLPAAIVAGMIVSFLLRMGSFLFPEIIQFIACGAGGSAGTVLCGLYVAPRKTQMVKWTLIILAALLGLVSALGVLLAGKDKLEATIGISMIMTAFTFSGFKPNEITEPGQQLNPGEKQ